MRLCKQRVSQPLSVRSGLAQHVMFISLDKLELCNIDPFVVTRSPDLQRRRGGGLAGYHDPACNYHVLSVLVSDQSTASYIINSYYVVQLAS